MKKNMFLFDSKVAVTEQTGSSYPLQAPYHPSILYPEFEKYYPKISAQQNDVYGMIRNLLHELSLDTAHFNTKKWNPFSAFINIGDTVVIKPNAVLDINQNANEPVYASITHGSVIRTVVDYVYLALKGSGKIIIADAPLAHSNFTHWKEMTGMNLLQRYYKDKFKYSISVLDLRELYAPFDYKRNFVPSNSRETTIRDPQGQYVIDLKNESQFNSFTEKDFKLLYGSDFDRSETIKQHLHGSHKYCVSGTILSADVLISIPKLKTHTKVGTTLNIKGMVGTQSNKNYIPHYRIGPPSLGGDEYPDGYNLRHLLNRYRMFLIEHLLVQKNRYYEQLYLIGSTIHDLALYALLRVNRLVLRRHYDVVIGGSWYGNDTAWRMALDLTKIVLYANKYGVIKKDLQRKFFSIIDGVVSGQGEGPLAPEHMDSGILIGGFNPVFVDIVATRLMGFSPMKIKMYKVGFKQTWLNMKNISLKQISIKAKNRFFRNMLKNKKNMFNFKEPIGWKGHLK